MAELAVPETILSWRRMFWSNSGGRDKELVGDFVELVNVTVLVFLVLQANYQYRSRIEGTYVKTCSGSKEAEDH